MESGSRCSSPASTISLEENSAGHDNSLLTIQSHSNGQLNESLLHEALFAALSDEQQHWVHVQHLDPSTNNESLREIFYHFGANDAFVMPPGGCAGVGARLCGYVSFSHPAMASLAIEKVNTFVPLRQTGPLTVVAVTASNIREDLGSQSKGAAQVSQASQVLLGKQLWEVLHPSQLHKLQAFLSTHWQLSNETLAKLVVESIESTLSVQRINLATMLCQESVLSKAPRGEGLRAALLCELSRYSGPLSGEIERMLKAGDVQPAAVRVAPSSAQTQRRVHNLTQRTVYLSKIPSDMRSATLLHDLSQYGHVLKLRLCRGVAGGALYAFAEMDTVASAVAIVGCGQLFVQGYALRTQHAKSPIQDASPSDAVVGHGGIIMRPCVPGDR